MLSAWNRMGLQKKTILPVVILLLVGMLVIQRIVVSSVRRISYDSFRKAGDTLAKLVASNSSYAVEWEEMEDLERVLKGVEHYRDAVFVGVLKGQKLLLGFERDEGGSFRKVSSLMIQRLSIDAIRTGRPWGRPSGTPEGPWTTSHPGRRWTPSA